MSVPRKVRIATRESQLALAQTRMFAAALSGRGAQVELVPMTTRGDRVLDRPLAQVGGKGLFVKELEHAMSEGRADLAVHSMKDVPMVLPSGFALATFGEREVPLDALVSNRHDSLASLGAGARVGTSSLRREAQLRHKYPRLDVRPLRGNVNTRLAKLDAGDYDAIVLAAAGLRRLGFGDRVRALLDDSIPAIGQGILAVEFPADRDDLARLLAPLERPETAAAARAERALGLVVEGSCEVPLGGHARVENGRLALDAFIGLPDGSRLARARDSAPLAEAEALGRRVAGQLLASGGREILALLRAPGAAGGTA
jgi:hydroxymethylbilane synthase